jgi:SlyX protein
VTELELIVTHLQNDLEQMNSVVLLQQADLDAVKKHLANLEAQLAEASQSDDSQDPSEERPPHY